MNYKKFLLTLALSSPSLINASQDNPRELANTESGDLTTANTSGALSPITHNRFNAASSPGATEETDGDPFADSDTESIDAIVSGPGRNPLTAYTATAQSLAGVRGNRTIFAAPTNSSSRSVQQEYSVLAGQASTSRDIAANNNTDDVLGLHMVSAGASSSGSYEDLSRQRRHPAALMNRSASSGGNDSGNDVNDAS